MNFWWNFSYYELAGTFDVMWKALKRFEVLLLELGDLSEKPISFEKLCCRYYLQFERMLFFQQGFSLNFLRSYLKATTDVETSSQTQFLENFHYFFIFFIKRKLLRLPIQFFTFFIHSIRYKAMNKRSKIFKQTSLSEWTWYQNVLVACLHTSLPCCWQFFLSILCFFFSTGNGLIDETEFLQWIAKIQALRDTETSAEDDDLTQDLVAAFR